MRNAEQIVNTFASLKSGPLKMSGAGAMTPGFSSSLHLNDILQPEYLKSVQNRHAALQKRGLVCN